MEELVIWLVSHLQGIDGLTLLIIILLFGLLFYLARPDASRADSRRRNQAHRIR